MEYVRTLENQVRQYRSAERKSQYSRAALFGSIAGIAVAIAAWIMGCR